MDSLLKKLIAESDKLGPDYLDPWLPHIISGIDPPITRLRSFTADAVLITEIQSQTRKDLRQKAQRLSAEERALWARHVTIRLKEKERLEVLKARYKELKEKLTPREWNIYLAIRGNLKARGLEYCQLLDAAGLSPRPDWLGMGARPHT